MNPQQELREQTATSSPGRSPCPAASTLVALIVLTCAPLWAAGGRPALAEEPAGADRLAWFREARFGIMITWGLHALPAGRWQGKEVKGLGEWIQARAKIPVAEYERLAARFNPTAFDATAWSKVIRGSGARYVCPMAKHHDGFALFRSAASSFNVVDATPFGRDIIAELAAAARAEGLTFCFYYSQIRDWHEPDAQGNTWDWPGQRDYAPYLQRKALPQLRELLTGYGPIGMIWFDTPEGLKKEQAQDIVRLVRELQPDCLLNGRLMPERRACDYATTPDCRVPGKPMAGPWEVPMTIRKGTWGYKEGTRLRTLDDLLFILVDVVSKGGNLLLNIGPQGDGSIPAEEVELLAGIGAWLGINGEAIYDADRSPFGHEFAGKSRDWRCTRKGDRLYLHLFTWPEGGRFVLDGALPRPATAVAVLTGDGEQLMTFTQEDGNLRIDLPTRPAARAPTVVAVDLVGDRAAP